MVQPLVPQLKRAGGPQQRVPAQIGPTLQMTVHPLSDLPKGGQSVKAGSPKAPINVKRGAELSTLGQISLPLCRCYSRFFPDP